MIPGWVLKRLEAWHADAKTGTVTLNFRDGQIKHLETSEIQRPPADVRPSCQACGTEMLSRDGGEIWVCACGAKRTRGQMNSLTRQEQRPVKS